MARNLWKNIQTIKTFWILSNRYFTSTLLSISSFDLHDFGQDKKLKVEKSFTHNGNATMIHTKDFF
jgi:hypothetical protein